MLQINSVSKKFVTGADVHTALDNVNLHVEKGDFITMIGSNGAGKSTLFNSISGNITVDSGQIILDGKDITFLPPHKRAGKIGRLFQDPMRGTAPDMTVAENLALAYHSGSWLAPITKNDKEFFYQLLKDMDLGLENRMERLAGLLSGGQRQALSLLMATVNAPSLLLLDEHTAALDPAAAEKVLAMTEKVIHDNNLTCIMVTHNMSQALELGNRLIMMDSGRIVADIRARQKKDMTVNDLISMFKSTGNTTDRVLLG